MKIKHKILLVIVTLVVVLVSGILAVTDYKVSELLNRNVQNQLDANLKLGYSLLEQKYPGEWRVEGNNMYKGNKLINGDTEFIDEIMNTTKSPATIALGDTRISTNIVIDGKRIVGTKISKEVSDIVLKEGKTYKGEAEILNSTYEAEYYPIKDKNGNNIGIWFVGVEKSTIKHQIYNLMKIIALFTCTIVAISIFIVNLFTNRIDKNIKIILDYLRTISQGNLMQSCKINSSDEIMDIANGLNSMSENIKILIKDLKNSSRVVSDSSDSLSVIISQTATATEEIAKAIEDVAKSANDQTINMQEGDIQVNQLSSKIEMVSDTTNSINDISNKVSDLNDKGLEIVRVLIEKSKENNDASIRVNEVVLKVDESAQEIGIITNTIRSIAQQTNLLALNAAIEAARAGEYGRGFTVVAEEVRKLAEQSAVSAQKIDNLIHLIQQQSKEAVNTIEETKPIIEQHDIAVKGTEDIFYTISNSIEILIKNVQGIKVSSDEMIEKKNEIVKMIEYISATTEETSAATQEIAASTEEQLATIEQVSSHAMELKMLSEDLEKSINKFQV